MREKVMHRLDVKKPAQGGLVKKKRAGKRGKSHSALLHAQTVLRQQGPTAQSRHDDTAGAARRGAEHDGDRVGRKALAGDLHARGIAHELETELRRRAGAPFTNYDTLDLRPLEARTVRRRRWWPFGRAR
ncbi:hypothetical protein D3C72_2000230 [compost metagenome]